MAQQFTIPGGSDKGKVLTDMSITEKSLGFWADSARDDGLKAACIAELARRRGTGGGAPAPKSTALASQQAPTQSIVAPIADGKALVGAFADPAAITAALMQAQQHYHVVTPAMSVGGIPEGCEIYTSLVIVDPYGPEVYNITGSRQIPKDDDSVGIDKVALSKIWAALGGSWQYSRRVDNNSHPHYCAWEAAGLYEQFDGKVCRVLGNVDIDVRAPNGAAYVEICEKAARPDKYGKTRDPNQQLLELRKFLARHTETKAMNKAISGAGVRRSYKRIDLKKPFLVARLAVTGRTDNPRLREKFAEMHYASRLAGTAALYGGAPALPAPAAQNSSFQEYDETEFESRAPVTYSMSSSRDPRSGDIETQGESGSEPKNEAPERKSEPPANGQAATAGAAQADPKPAADPAAKEKPNYAEGEADL